MLLATPVGGFTMRLFQSPSILRKPKLTRSTSSPCVSITESQRSRKNIMAYLGEEEQKSLPSSPENSVTPRSKLPQRRSGLFQGQKLRDYSRSFHDVLGYFKVHGIENGFGAQYGEMEDQECLQVEESWTMVIKYSPDFPKKLRDQQEAIWELVTTEVSYISKLRVIIKLFLMCLEGLQAEKHLTEVDASRLFGNINQVYSANMEFWKKHLSHVVEKAREEKTPLSPDILENGFSKFSEIFFPYIQYCTEENHCLVYLKSKMKESEKFREYLEWCENHKLCNRLKLTDLLVKPMQRVTKYPLLLKAILKKTHEAKQRKILEDMISKVENFVSKVNTTVRIRQERKKLHDVISRIDLYTPVEPVNDEVEKILGDHCSFNLESSVPGLPENEHRCVLKEGPMKLTEKQGRSDIYAFLFTDMFLVTKLKRGVDKYRIIKQPYRLSKVVLHPLRDSSGFLFIYLNEYNVLTSAFILTSAGSASDQQEWIHAIDLAKRRYVSARMGQGSTYDFFEDNSLLPFQPSPQHSPQPMRKFLGSAEPQFDAVPRSRSAELSVPSLSAGEDLFPGKARASSDMEPIYKSAPSVSGQSTCRSDNRVARSRSDPKAEKNPRLSAITEKSRTIPGARPVSPFWDGKRPVSMLVDSSSQDYSMSSIVEERRARSESLPIETEEVSHRSERFRSTNSDSALSHKDDERETIKPCSSVPLMGSDTNLSISPSVLRRKADFTSDDNTNSSLSLSSSNNMQNGSVSSSSASMSIDQQLTDLVTSSSPGSEVHVDAQSEAAMDGPLPLDLHKHSDLIESSVDDTLVMTGINHIQTSPNTDFCPTDALVTVEVQTEAFVTPTQSVGVQCDLCERIQISGTEDNSRGNVPHFGRALSLDAIELSSQKCRLMDGEGCCRKSSPFFHPGLRHSMSMTDISMPFNEEDDEFIHSRSLSDGTKPSPQQVRSTPTSPRLRKNTREGPGMRALQVLSQNLETTINSRTRSSSTAPTRADPRIPSVVKRMSSSPRSLRRFALLNTSPILPRKSRSTDETAMSRPSSASPKLPGAVPKLIKRASWHVDTISQLELMERGLAESRLTPGSAASMAISPSQKLKGMNGMEVNGKVEGTSKENKFSKKRWTIGEIPGGVVSGPNLDKRGVRKHFLDESLIFGAPEYV